MQDNKSTIFHKLKEIFLGKSIQLGSKNIFHRLSLIAFFAWVGLGADGLSSSCYGPNEAYAILGEHTFLAALVGLASALTIFIISASYSQIIELFPQGGGGYFVASQLLHPSLGMLSGCALIIDYVLTITLSIASGADAIFSMLPGSYLELKVPVALCCIVILTLLNLRGVKESVSTLVPIFMLFVFTHAFIIIYSLIYHALDAPAVMLRFENDLSSAHSQLGMLGLIFLLLKAFSMGAGTFTGIEAVSNGLPMLREPRVETGKRTMLYMAVSLSVTVVGLMAAYTLYELRLEPGKTLNALLVQKVVSGWPGQSGSIFILITLASEAFLLFAAAQTGFLDGPRVLANMAVDRWLPTRFAILSDRLVTQNGILLFSGCSVVLLLVSSGKVSHLVVLYSINVFITFVLSQLGMVRHWWLKRKNVFHWRRKLLINGIGLFIAICILFAIIIVKFEEGGWITLFVTSGMVLFALTVKKHYGAVQKLVKRLDPLIRAVKHSGLPIHKRTVSANSPLGTTAILLVSGFNGLGLQTLLYLLRFYGHNLQNIVFISIGIVDSAVFRSANTIDDLKKQLVLDTEAYVDLVRKYGFNAEAVWAVGTDVVDEVMQLLPALRDKYPRSIVCSGQMMFQHEGLFSRLLHNYHSFSLQRACFEQAIPFMIIPVHLEADIDFDSLSSPPLAG